MALPNRHVVITGGAGSLARAAARHFLAAGASVVLADIDEVGLARAAADLPAPTLHTLRCDVADPGDCTRLVQQAEVFFGGPLDVFLANAGRPFAGPLAQADPAEVRRVIDVNVTGSILSAQAALASLVRGREPCLLFTGSLQSVAGRAERSVYTASKHAVAGLVKALALEFGPLGVRVNGVAPTVVDTPFLRQAYTQAGVSVEQGLEAAARGLPLGRIPTADDFAATAVFLASPAAAAITGQMVMVDCGATAGKFG